MLLDITNLDKTFHKNDSVVEALKGVNLSVAEGEFISLLGPSGCGKSTLMRIIAGLQPATNGEVRLGGNLVTKPIDGLGVVFQSPLLLQWRKIIDNVLLPIEMAGLSKKKYVAQARELLHTVGLEGFEDRLPGELSGGMKQRVALCRALILDPKILLMDEPFGALDAMTRDEMNLLLARMYEAQGAEEEKKTVIFVTHSIPEAVFLADRVVVMSARPGRIKHTVDVNLQRPRNLEVRVSPEFGEITGALYEELNVSSGALLDRD